MNEEFDLDELAPWLVIVITFIGLGLRAFALASKGLWLDETFSIWMANHSAPEIVQLAVRYDQHPPLYYLLLHSWIALKGSTPYEFRMLSALFGAAAIPFIYLIGKRISGAVMGLAAATFLALSPFNIVYSQETRMYTLLAFNASVAIYALVRLLTDPCSAQPIGSQFLEYLKSWRTPGPVERHPKGDLRDLEEANLGSRWRGWLSRHRWLPIQALETDLAWVGLIVFSAATLYSHNTGVLFLFAINVYVIGLMLYQRKKKPTRPPAFRSPSPENWVKAQLGILLLWSPWLMVFFRQAGRVNQEFWIPKPDWDTVLQTLRLFLNASGPGQVNQLLPVWILFTLVLLLGVAHFWKKKSIAVFLAALFAIPFLTELIVSLRRPIFLDKTLIWITIPLFLLMAAGIAQLKYRLLILAVVGILGTVNMFSTADYYRFFRKEDWSNPAGYVAYFVEPDDLVLFNSPMVQIAFDYYFKQWEDQYSLQVERHGVPDDVFARGILEPKMTESDIPGLVSQMEGHKRVWLVYSHNDYTDPQGLIAQTLASTMKLSKQQDYYGVQLQFYEAP